MLIVSVQNINAFLERQNAQFDEAVSELTAVRTGLDGTRSAQTAHSCRTSYRATTRTDLTLHRSEDSVIRIF